MVILNAGKYLMYDEETSVVTLRRQNTAAKVHETVFKWVNSQMKVPIKTSILDKQWKLLQKKIKNANSSWLNDEDASKLFGLIEQHVKLKGDMKTDIFLTCPSAKRSYRISCAEKWIRGS